MRTGRIDFEARVSALLEQLRQTCYDPPSVVLAQHVESKEGLLR